MNPIILTQEEDIKAKIYTIRGLQVMLDRDLAELYGVETRRLNEQVKRNSERFPTEFMFQLTKQELENWISQFATSNKELMGLRKLPFAFSEQGVSMLSAVLKSKSAIEMSIQIIKSFVAMKKFMANNALIFQRLDILEQKQFLTHEKIDLILSAIEDKSIKPKQGIFYNGQMYDAYIFMVDLIKSATSEIILIDNYLDESVFTLLSKRNKDVKATLYTQNITKELELDLKKHNAQYPPIMLKKFNQSHDRFLILDHTNVYHIGASLKDLGKKWFAFSKLDIENLAILERIEKHFKDPFIKQ
ncbi:MULTISPECIES: ORF6N domain-containing protein [unclassified Sulfurospirillum]|uniref:ORF6N domain-containing protein n=1 Tax=unclassified Sulfurospirillum TaxID=2618290 RepID=UPI000504C085|nr:MULTISPECIES: ORF6N domain-containing protein [unclassified Sulfurospirillum]KFL35058.1 DNA-binding protein [Sulfurospirillum sp. SCADC]